MSDVIDQEELKELIELGKPVAGDDEQTVMFRYLIRSTTKIIQGQRILAERTVAVEAQTAKCIQTHEVVDALQKTLAPADNPNGHIHVRVSKLETGANGVVNLLKANSGAIALALMYGAWQLLQVAGK